MAVSELIRIETAAGLVGVDPDELTRRVRHGELSAWRIGGRVMVAIDELTGCGLVIERDERAKRGGAAGRYPRAIRRCVCSAVVTGEEFLALRAHVERLGERSRAGWIRRVLLDAAHSEANFTAPVSTPGTRRSHVNAPVSESELATIEAAAVRSGLSRATWARAVLLDELST